MVSRGSDTHLFINNWIGLLATIISTIYDHRLNMVILRYQSRFTAIDEVREMLWCRVNVEWYTWTHFSCDKAAPIMVQSACLSVPPSHPVYNVPVIVSWKYNATEVKINFASVLVFPDFNSNWKFADGNEMMHKAWSGIEEVFCFNVKRQIAMGQIYRKFWPNLRVSRL